MGIGMVIPAYTHTHTDNRLTPFVRDNPGRPVPEETFTHSHSTWSSVILYHLPPFTTIIYNDSRLFSGKWGLGILWEYCTDASRSCCGNCVEMKLVHAETQWGYW